MYSYRIEQAIRAAAILHQGQLCRGRLPLPYLAHLVATAFTLMDYTDDEDVIIAGLLHDALARTGYTAEEMRADFGSRVCDIVEAATPPRLDDDGAAVLWGERQRAYAARLKRGAPEALLVAAADMIHDFRTTVESYHDAPKRFIQDFGENHDERFAAYHSLANVLNSRLENPILAEFNQVFEEYKRFLSNVKTH
jgi:(p)ppGpp synthase/HD superfamily hydrolase